MTLHIVLDKKSKKKPKTKEEKENIFNYIKVPSRHLALFYNVWIRWYDPNVREGPGSLHEKLSGGFLVDLIKNEDGAFGVFKILRNSELIYKELDQYIFLAPKDALNCRSLEYVMNLEKNFTEKSLLNQ